MTRPALETTRKREDAQLGFDEDQETYCTLAEGDELVKAGVRVTWLRRIVKRASDEL